MFENKLIKGIHVSRYIASWRNVGGRLDYDENGSSSFYKWLLSLGLTVDDAKYIKHFALNGKFELENSAGKFLSEQH